MDNKEEEWKPIIGFEGLYEVSSCGKVRNAYGRIMSLDNNSKGYSRIWLCKGGKTYHFLVHRLVAEVFIENKNNYPVVHHKDENRSNNNVWNLEWCTYKQNSQSSIKKLIEGSRKRSKKPVAQYTQEGTLIKIYRSQADAAEETKIKFNTINNCLRGVNKTGGGYRWCYV